jgi:hypothetical protein
LVSGCKHARPTSNAVFTCCSSYFPSSILWTPSSNAFLPCKLHA